jgi:hypothetical protein
MRWTGQLAKFQLVSGHLAHLAPLKTVYKPQLNPRYIGNRKIKIKKGNGEGLCTLHTILGPFLGTHELGLHFRGIYTWYSFLNSFQIPTLDKNLFATITTELNA